jgi:phosphatidylserine decarboxylase
MVGALFVGSIETVFAGEINPPGRRGGRAHSVEAGIGRQLPRGEELGRFNMGSTVVLLLGNHATRFAAGLAPGATLRLGQAMAQVA